MDKKTEELCAELFDRIMNYLVDEAARNIAEEAAKKGRDFSWIFLLKDVLYNFASEVEDLTEDEVAEFMDVTGMAVAHFAQNLEPKQ